MTTLIGPKVCMLYLRVRYSRVSLYLVLPINYKDPHRHLKLPQRHTSELTAAAAAGGAPVGPAGVGCPFFTMGLMED